MSLRVCIPTAGTGSRLGESTRFINKSLVSIANRPILSHLIEQFPENAEFVIALGYKGHLVREFLELAYPERVFLYSEVNPYVGPGSGLGWSLLQCRHHLQQPFVFLSCDTLVREPIPPLGNNWIGYAEREDVTPYRTVQVHSGVVENIGEKGQGRPPEHKPYIGLAGIADYAAFWQAMQSGGEHAIEAGEAYGLRHLIGKKILAHPFTWFDTGNPASLKQARAAYEEPDSPIILEKANEAIWFVDNHVIKFSDDQSFIANRVQRVAELDTFVPIVTGKKSNMYRYQKVDGSVLSAIVDPPLFENFLEHCKVFWKEKQLSDGDRQRFRANCLRFYKNKSLERIDLFYQNFQRVDGTETINGIAMPTLSQLLNKLDWDWLSDGLPGRFHGDFHFENILWSDSNHRFTFLDWRQDFAGSLETGDIYYDLAKLLHGLIINHELIAGDHFRIDWTNQGIRYDFHRKQSLVDCEIRFSNWLIENSLDTTKVRTLTALIFLNIAALHHYPYSLLLYALGKSMLSREIGN